MDTMFIISIMVCSQGVRKAAVRNVRLLTGETRLYESLIPLRGCKYMHLWDCIIT